MIEPAAPTPAPRRTRVILAGATLMAVLAAGAVLVAGSDEPEPLALVAGAGSGSESARSAGPLTSGDTPYPGPPGDASSAGAGAADNSLAVYPGWPGIEFRVKGELPDLGDRSDVWAVHSPDFDAGEFRRIAAALGLGGDPVRGHGGWVLENGDFSLSAWPGDGWSINFNHMRFGADRPRPGPGAGARVGSAEEAEGAARDVLDEMGVLEGEWEAQTFATELGVGFGCAVPGKMAPDLSAEEKVAEEATRPDSPVSSDAPPAGECPAPPPPVPAYSVSLFPLLDGRRADWMGWNVTLRQDGGIENLSGIWASFERRGGYKLRPVEAALDDLRAGGGPGPRPLFAQDAAEPATGTAEPAIGAPEPAIAPVAPCPVPAAMDDMDNTAVASFPQCGPVDPAVVTITGVELGLTAAPVFEDGSQRLHLVPAYRFLGTFEGGEPYETSVIALHPEAIAPPPAVDGGRQPAPSPVPPGAVEPAPPGAASGPTGAGEPGAADPNS
jgi:hypothetical protein